MSMDNENDVVLDSSPTEDSELFSEEQSTTVEEDNKPQAEPIEVKPERTVPYDRFKEVNNELKKLKNTPPKTVNNSLDVEDYIDISASLEGLDQKEKEYLAKQHKYTGKSLKDIREDEDFKLWQSAYQAKVVKEKLTLAPSGVGSEVDKPVSLNEQLKNASLADKEKLLTEMGLYKQPNRRNDTTQIGR